MFLHGKKENVKRVTTIIITLCNYVLHPCIFYVKWIYTIRASHHCLKGFGIMGGLSEYEIIIFLSRNFDYLIINLLEKTKYEMNFEYYFATDEGKINKILFHII